MEKQKLPIIRFLDPSHDGIRIEDRFFSGAQALRKKIETTFGNPLAASTERFCWDFWSIQDQYRLLRTPAEPFFGRPLFDPFMSHLLKWGRENLGCQMVSHPWLSAYVDGCHQNLHSDVPHGPFSFVFSLTPWKKRRFSGGETFVAKPKLLRYFEELDPSISDEQKNLISKIPPEFNRLTVFDPRFPHGVTPVHGVDNILESRMVIHGWFTEPRPMLDGALTFKKIMKPMDQFALEVMEDLSRTNTNGLLSVRLHIEPDGRIKSIDILSGNLLDRSGRRMASKTLYSILQRNIIFPKSRGRTSLTLPLVINP
jgi:hypothetical protein